MSFAEILEAVEILPMSDRIELSKLIQLQIIEDNRDVLSNEINQSMFEFQSGSINIQSIDEIMDDLLI